MENRRFIIRTTLLAAAFFLPSFIFAETVVLKSGKTVEGKLIEKTDKYIKIDFQGVQLSYFYDEIETINGQKPGLPTNNNAVANKEGDLFEAIKKGDIQKVQQAINAGADVNAKNEGAVALVWAVNSCHEEIVELLLDSGAKVNIRHPIDGPMGGMTPLMWAAHRCKKDMVELLLAKGADIEMKDNNGKTAWIWSAVGRDKDVLELFLSKGVNVNSRDNSGATALMWAAGMGNKDNVELLLSKGADINAKNNYGATAVMYAEKYAKKFGKYEIVEILTAKLLNYDNNLLKPSIHFNPPNGWQKIVTNAGLSVSYYQPERKASIVITLPYPATNSDFTNLLATTRREGKLISEGKKELLGVSCYILTYEMPNSEGTIFRIRNHIFFKKGKVFTIVYIASPLDFNNYLPDFESALSTFDVELK